MNYMSGGNKKQCVTSLFGGLPWRNSGVQQSNAGDFDVFVMKFDSDGAHQWTILRGGSGDDFAYGLQARCATPPSDVVLDVKFLRGVDEEALQGCKN